MSNKKNKPCENIENEQTCNSIEINNSLEKSKRWTKQETNRLRIASKIIDNPRTEKEWITISKFVGRHSGLECKNKFQKIQFQSLEVSPLSEKETKCKKKDKNNFFNSNLDEDFFADKFDKDSSIEIDPNDSLLLAMLTPENRLKFSKRTFFLKSIHDLALPNDESSTSNDD